MTPSSSSSPSNTHQIVSSKCVILVCLEGFDIYVDSREVQSIVESLSIKLEADILCLPHADTISSCNGCDVISPLINSEDLLLPIKKPSKSLLIKNLPQIYCFPLFIIRDERLNKKDNEDFRHIFNQRKFDIFMRNKIGVDKALEKLGNIDVLIMFQKKNYKRGDLIQERYWTMKDKLEMLCKFKELIFFDYREDSIEWLIKEIDFRLNELPRLISFSIYDETEKN